MSALRDHLAQLSREERMALESRLLLQARPPSPSISRSVAGPLPLSFAQESLWFFDQLAPGSALYHIPMVYQLVGPLERPALAQALESLIQRHPALHTQFRDDQGTPTQCPVPQPVHLEFTDLEALPDWEQERAVQSALEEFVRRPFRLSDDLMLRAQLIRLHETDHRFALVVHHIVADFTSLEVLVRELGQGYNAALQGARIHLGSVPASFPVWAAEQRRRFESHPDRADLDFWRDELSAPVPPLALPADRVRPAAPSFRGAHRPFELAPALTSALPELARKENVTRYMLLLSAFEILLRRYSGQAEFLVGTPVSQRGAPGTEQAVGFFLNTVLLRADLKGNPTFRELLQRTRLHALASFSHQAAPFEKLAETLHWPRVPGVNPLCQAVFQLLPSGWPKLGLSGVRARPIPVETGTAKFDLTLTLYEEEGSVMRGDLEFNTDLFEPGTADQWIRSFKELLHAAVAHPDESITRLPLLSPDEEIHLLHRWNQTRAAYPREASVHQLFEAQAERTPDRTALISGSESITYAELNRRANQLAHRLVQLALRPGDLVGIATERNFEMIVGLLGILKAGAAYVPFDPENPPDRLARMVANSGVGMLLTTSHLAERFPIGLRRLLFDAENEELASCSKENLPPRAAAESLAYVLYTSGSTGEPKGVAVPHRAIVRLVTQTNYASFGPEEVFLQFAPLAFDASTFEIWGAFLNGAKLVLYPPRFESLEQFASVLRESKVTTLWLTAGLFHQMVDHHLDGLAHVRQLLAGGDVLSVPHVLKALRELPHCQLINGYGPTENTTFSCCYRFSKDWDGTRPAPIGYPISNSQAFILDEHLTPVPAGVAGELCLAGDGLAQGYWNSPELTARKFVTLKPFGIRVYRSGDRARYLPDGSIEFLGRGDDQVKVNGYRIHLAEVEAALPELPGVRQAVVAARPGPNGGHQLTAYLVLDEAASGVVTELRKAVAAKLPAYMVPSQFVILDELPLTRNGKVDRARLPVSDSALSPSTRTLAPAENSDQAAILSIWKEVFGHDQIGIDDSFFDLGGHSLMATRVISRINQAFQRNLTLASLFEAGTVRVLAERVAAAPIQPVSTPIRRRSGGRAHLANQSQ